jgi:hypothetical protein
MINLVLKRSARVAAETEQCVLEMDLEIGIGDAPWLVGLCLCGAGPTPFGLAVLALVDERVRARVAQRAVPLDYGGVGLDHLEIVLAAGGGGHGIGVARCARLFACVGYV